MTEPCDLSATEARRLMGERKLSPVELLESCIARIERTNAAVNSIVAMDADAARKRAKEIEQAIGRGEDVGLLAGLPIGVKDLQATAGLRTTFGSLLYKDNVPAEDEFNVANVRRAGGIILGKTNTPEFGAGANTTNRVYGPTGNPFDPAKTCAGSSGGSAVALALGQVALATGSDLGGSLRTPASFCGVAGFRPSPGVVPSVDRAGEPHALQRQRARWAARWRTRICCCGRRWARTSATRSPPSDNARIPATLDRRRSRRAARRRVARSRLRAHRSRHRRSVQARASRHFRHAFKEVQERAPDFGPRARHLRGAPLRAVRGGASRAPGEIARPARPQRHRQHRARLEALARRREPRPRRADQALQALPRLLQGRGRADLPGGLGLAVPACAAVRRGDQRREDADLHALARHHLRARRWRWRAPRPCRAASTTRACPSASRSSAPTAPTPACWKWRTRWSRCWRADKETARPVPPLPVLTGRGPG